MSENPDRPYSSVRVAIWALGVIGLVLAVTFAMLVHAGKDVPPSLPGVLGTIVGGLTMAAGGRRR